jgi:acyl carrier protein phosphodiesterase
MAEDKWVTDVVNDLRRARTRVDLLDVMERIEDRYDAFSGPGQELMDQLLEEARRRLAELS